MALRIEDLSIWGNFETESLVAQVSLEFTMLPRITLNCLGFFILVFFLSNKMFV